MPPASDGLAREVPAADFVWGDSTGPAAYVASVREASAAADGTDPLDEAAVLRLKHQGLGQRRRLWLAGPLGAESGRGSPDGGFGLIEPSLGELPGPSLGHVAVAPSVRGRGLGGALAHAVVSGAGNGPLAAWSHGNHPAAARLAARLGFERARELWWMRRPMSLAVPEPVSPAGVEIRGYRPSDAEELLAVNAAAFASHPEQGAMDADNLAARMAEPWFDPDGLLVAEKDGRVVGFHWTKRVPGSDAGEVYVVGISPDSQTRGLGKALTLAGLQHLASLGVAEATLFVESDNRPALALYNRVGFTHDPADTHVMYRRTAAQPGVGRA